MPTIIMYHYVRDLPATRYPDIKGLLTQKFEGQLDYIAKHYTVCSLRQVVSAMRGEADLPPNACLLTFDDGFVDHYVTVFPLLDERGMVGSFFPTVKATVEHRVLDVHKVQFILAATRDYQKLIREILDLIREFRGEHEIPAEGQLYETYARPGRYDPAEVIFIKRVLQMGLPEPVRLSVLDTLFRRSVGEDEAAFAAELYISVAQLRCMARHGMEIGGHGYSHARLGLLSPGEQAEEIARTVDLLTAVYGCRPPDWAIAYPSGSYNATTIALLKQAGSALGLTTRVGLVDATQQPFELQRLDTNDIPCAGDAALSEWTMKALA